MGVPKPGCFNLVVCNFYAETLFCALLRPLALFCALAVALFCAHLFSFAVMCVFLRTTAFRTITFGNSRRARLGYPGKNPGISRQKVWFPWVSKDIPNFLAPTPLHGRPPPYLKISGPKCLRLGPFFFPETNKGGSGECTQGGSQVTDFFPGCEDCEYG